MGSQFDDIDRLMAADDTIEPSSGFADEVMAGVHAVVEAPPPARFPWGRFLFGVGACLLWAVAGLTVLRGVDLPVPPFLAGGPTDETWQLLQLATVVGIVTLAVLRLGLTPFRR